MMEQLTVSEATLHLVTASRISPQIERTKNTMIVVGYVIAGLLLVYEVIDTIKFVKLLYSLKEFFDTQGDTPHE